jgi:hypothetical protein
MKTCPSCKQKHKKTSPTCGKASCIEKYNRHKDRMKMRRHKVESETSTPMVRAINKFVLRG